MNLFFCTWYAVGDITASKLVAQQSVALLMLAGSLLVFRTFRERYLLLWIVGWLAYFVSRGTLLGGGICARHLPVFGRGVSVHPLTKASHAPAGG